jgi:peroxiredoxin
MTEIPQQPSIPSLPAQSRRFQIGLARVALVLVLLAAGVGLLAGAREKTAVPSESRLSGSGGDNRSPAVAACLPSLEEILARADRIPTHDHPLIGRPAPHFTLEDAREQAWNFQDLQAGSSLVLIFYNGYLCPNCVRQLFEVNSDLPLFHQLGARVAAISADSPELTRERFEQYGRFGFPVLSDPGNKVRQAYQVLRQSADGNLVNLLRHGIFIIDRHGTVQWANVGDAPFRRNSALLYHLAKIERGAVP